MIENFEGVCGKDEKGSQCYLQQNPLWIGGQKDCCRSPDPFLNHTCKMDNDVPVEACEVGNY